MSLFLYSRHPIVFPNTMIDTLEPFGLECNCENPSCKHAFERYQVVYTKYANAIEESRTLADQNRVLSNDTTHTIDALECRIQMLHRNLELEGAVIKAFQGDIDQDRPLLQNQNVCPNCIGHRKALMVQRQFVSNDADAAMARHDNTKEIIRKCREDVIAAELVSGKLRRQLTMKDDPFGRNKEIQALRAELDQAVGGAAELKSAIAIMKQENESNRQKLTLAAGIIESLQSELCNIKAERDVLKGGMFTGDNALTSQLRFDAAVTQYRQMAEGRGVKRVCVEEDP
jgi:hypothetical protein